MTTLLLVIHAILALLLIVFVLLQRSEGGALGFGGSNNGGVFNVRGTANFLTRTTALLAAGFMITSIVLAIIYARSGGKGDSIINDLPTTNSQQQPSTTPAAAPTPSTKQPTPSAADQLKTFDAPAAPKAQ